jgi:hypothetical protein
VVLSVRRLRREGAGLGTELTCPISCGGRNVVARVAPLDTTSLSTSSSGLRVPSSRTTLGPCSYPRLPQSREKESLAAASRASRPPDTHHLSLRQQPDEWLQELKFELAVAGLFCHKRPARLTDSYLRSSGVIPEHRPRRAACRTGRSILRSGEAAPGGVEPWPGPWPALP